ncbi:hypothetical protein FRB93_013881 [Tulasnella sp. JGI-2019a]|nr:hypothetical protein FRB93_013881 [Tulasnella sp. JGI-2019a]
MSQLPASVARRAGASGTGPRRLASSQANGPAFQRPVTPPKGNKDIIGVGVAALGFGGVYYYLMSGGHKDNAKVGSHGHLYNASPESAAAGGAPKLAAGSGAPTDASSSLQRALATDAPKQAFVTEAQRSSATPDVNEAASIQQAMKTDAPKTAYGAEASTADASTKRALNADAPKTAHQYEKGL